MSLNREIIIKRIIMFLSLLILIISLTGCNYIKQKAIANSISYIKNSPWEDLKKYIDLKKVDVKNARENTWKSVWTDKGLLKENIVDATDWVIIIGDTKGHAFAVIVCDSKTGKVIGHIPIE